MRKFVLTVTLLLWAVSAFAIEQFNNLATSTTTGQTSGATTLVVASAALFPATGTFTVGVDTGANYELERVTAVSGTTFTVTRGLSPTSAVSHSSGVAVVLVESAESFTQLEADVEAVAAGVGACVNQAVTATVAGAAPTCTTLTSSYLSNTGVTAQSYVNANITVDAAGRVTAASNGKRYATVVNSSGTSVTATCSAVSPSTQPTLDMVWQVLTGATTYTTPATSANCVEGDRIEAYFIQADNQSYQVTPAAGTGTTLVSPTIYTTPTSTSTNQGYFLHLEYEYHAAPGGTATPEWELIGQNTYPLTPAPTATGGTGADLHTAASGTYPKANGSGVYAASTLAAAGTGACASGSGPVGTLNGDAAPTCRAVNLANGDVTGTTPVANGGTSLATLTAHDVYVGNGTSAPTAISPSTSGFVLTSNGTSADPSFQAAGGSGTVYCTDNWTPGSTTLTGGTTYTAGHTYCLNAPGTVTATGAQNINVANVTIACPSPGMIIQRTSTTQLFVVTAAGFRLMGCGIDGNTQTTGNTGPLVNLNAADDALIENNIFTNTGTTAGTGLSGTIWVQAGNRDRIINNTFSTSQTDVAVWINSQTGTKVVNDLTIQDNKIPTFAPASNLYAITLNQASGNSSTHVKILDNTIALTNTHAEGIASITQAAPENTSILGLDVSGNHITATANVPRMMHLFGIDYGTVTRNVLDDGGNIVSGAVMDLGDDYNTAHVGNEISARSGSEAGLNCIDCAEDTFVGNTIDGIGNFDPAFLIGSSAAATSNNVISGNTIRLANAGTGIEIQANGAAASFNTVVGNTVIGPAVNLTTTGITVVDTSGGTAANTIMANTLTGFSGTSNTCLSVGSGATNTYVGNNNVNSCTTAFSDSGTGTNSPMVGVTAPTITAGCTAGGGNTVAGTDYNGVITTGATAATTCTMTFNHTWAGAPHCTFSDANASTTPVGYSAGAIGTTTAVVDFASAGNKKIAFSCGG